MPELLTKVQSIPNICGIDFAFSGVLAPSTIEGYQPFINSIPQNTNFQEAYFGKATVAFEEVSQETKAGTIYNQKLSIRFPVSDSLRAERIRLMHRVKFIKIKLSNGTALVLGRNDFQQNKRPASKTSVDERLAQAQFEVLSITPAGFAPSLDAGGLPVFFPINFINE